MRFIVPAVIADAQLIASNVAETDHAAWVAATAYNVGDRVIRVATHKIYERLVAGTTATAPESDPVNWGEVSATNRWKMFDRSAGSLTEAATTIAVTLAPGAIDSLSLIDLNASTVRVQMLDEAGGATVFDQTFAIEEFGGTVLDWDDYFFTIPRRKTSLIVENLPIYGNCRLTVTISDPSARCGTLVVGQTVVVGETLRGASFGISDWSKKNTNAYGVTSLKQGNYAKNIDVSVLVNNHELDYLDDRLTAARGTACVWIASRQKSALIVYGWLDDWRITIPYALQSEGRLSIKGLA